MCVCVCVCVCMCVCVCVCVCGDIYEPKTIKCKRVKIFIFDKSKCTYIKYA